MELWFRVYVNYLRRQPDFSSKYGDVFRVIGVAEELGGLGCERNMLNLTWNLEHVENDGGANLKRLIGRSIPGYSSLAKHYFVCRIVHACLRAVLKAAVVGLIIHAGSWMVSRLLAAAVVCLIIYAAL